MTTADIRTRADSLCVGGRIPLDALLLLELADLVEATTPSLAEINAPKLRAILARVAALKP